MNLESFKSELFNNKIEKPELIIGGKALNATAIWGVIVDSDGCLHDVIQGYQSDNC